VPERPSEPTPTPRSSAARPWMPPSGNRALAERLASAEPDETTAETPASRPVFTRAQPRSRNRVVWRVLAVLLVLSLVAGLAGVTAVAHSNKSRADDWEDRAFTLERHTEQLNGLLIERSTQLNERTRELNGLAAKVQRQQSALTRSESDVASLSRRQRELAAEKARVEDDRAALQVQSRELNSVANAFVACKDGLVALLGYVVEGDETSASAVVDRVGADCSRAETLLLAYRSRFG
jgi:alkylhydroperoxidase/carboxymuconolactone decarboxylase family protein YurZ